MLNCSRVTPSSFLESDDRAVVTFLRCVLILALGSSPALGQVPHSQTPDFTADAPAVRPDAESAPANLAIMSLRISSDFDDNALNSQQERQADLGLLVQPHLGWRISGARLDWASDYTMGISRSEKFSAYDSLSHLLDSRVQVRLTKRMTVIAHEVYLNSSNPFDQLQSFEVVTGQGTHIVPSQTTAIAPAGVRTDQSSADIAYALSAHSQVGAGGEFFDASYTLPSAGSSNPQLLQNSNSTIGHAFYTRQFTRHQWTGLEYRIQKSTFSGAQSSLVHSLAYTHKILVSSTMAFSFFVGPERSTAQNVAEMFAASQVGARPQSAWHWSGGMTSQWSRKGTTISVKLSRRIDNGGVLGAAEQTTLCAEMSHELGRGWSTKFLASHDHDAELLGAGVLLSDSIAGSLKHALTPNLSLELQYWRAHMSGNGSLPAGLVADHNRILLSLTYEHRRALGR